MKVSVVPWLLRAALLAAVLAPGRPLAVSSVGSEVRLLATPPSALAPVLASQSRAQRVWKTIAEGLDPFGMDMPQELGREAAKLLREAFPLEAARGELCTGVDAAVGDVAADGTTKILVHLQDGLMAETVLIPTDSRTTICVSSQVGCARACAFCSTGAMGLIRSLDAHEILGQLFAGMQEAQRRELPPLTNVVFMGMGEPADNLEQVHLAARTMVEGFRLGNSHISVSTVGPSPEAIEALESLPTRLAWSVHAAEDDVRRVLVPTTRHSMVELRDAFARVLARRRDRGLFVEVALVEGLNDSPHHALALAELLRPLPGKTRVNLLPYNPFAPEASDLPRAQAHALFRTPSPETVKTFQDVLYSEGFVCTVRSTRGADSASACGQLANRASLSQSRRPSKEVPPAASS